MDNLIRCDAFAQNTAIVPSTALPGQSDRSQPGFRTNLFSVKDCEVGPLPFHVMGQGLKRVKEMLCSEAQTLQNQRSEGDIKDSIAAKKVQKADREKLRRDRLNEQFLELGNILDPDRPKNDKATILTDTIQLVKDLTSQVNKLKAEYATLAEESRELTQEKNDLRAEKGSLKSDIDNLNAQYQQRLRATYPWAAMDRSVVMAPPFPFPMPMQMPPGPFPMHPSLQPYPFFGNQNPGVIANPCSTFIPYITPTSMVEQQSSQCVPPFVHPSNQSHNLSKQDSGNKSSGERKSEKSHDSNEVTTNLELKTPGSTTDQDTSSEQTKGGKTCRKENHNSEASSSSRCSSSRSVDANSSSSVLSGRKSMV